jgi:hypothetical protein
VALIRHKRTLVERTVPDAAVPFFPDYEVVDAKRKKPAAKPAAQEAGEPTEPEE